MHQSITLNLPYDLAAAVLRLEVGLSDGQILLCWAALAAIHIRHNDSATILRIDKDIILFPTRNEWHPESW